MMAKVINIQFWTRFASHLMGALNGADFRKYRKDQSELRLADYKETFSTPAGRRVLADILDRCGVMRQNDGFLHDVRSAGIEEGKRRIGLDLIHVMGKFPIDEEEQDAL